MPPLTLRLAEKRPRSVRVRDTPHRQHLTPGFNLSQDRGNLGALILHPRRPQATTAGEKAVQGNLPGVQSGTNRRLAVPSRDLTGSEKKPPPLLSIKTRRLPGPGLGPELPHVPCSPLRTRFSSSANRAGHTLPEGTPAAVLAGLSSEPRPERPQLPAAAPARAPCTAAAPETAPRRGSAGGTWCRRRAPPCPARAVLAAAPPAGPPLYLTVSGTTWRRRPARGLRRAGERGRAAGAEAGSPVLRGSSQAPVDVDHAREGGTWSSRRLRFGLDWTTPL